MIRKLMKNKKPIFLFECNNTRDVTQNLNGECPYRQYEIEYYVTGTNMLGYEKLMCINKLSAYAQMSDDVRKQKEKVAKDLAKRNPGHPVVVLSMDPRKWVSVEARIKEAIQVYEKTGMSLRVVRAGL